MTATKTEEVLTEQEDIVVPEKKVIKWNNLFLLIFSHVNALLGIPAFFFAQWKTLLFFLIYLLSVGYGVTGGAHRFWTHRSFKAKTPLQIIMMVFYSASGMNTLYDWVRDHRVHHKFSETDADPHNARRGFFFSHVGWLLTNKHPEVIRKGRQIDMSDIDNNPIVQFHQKYFWILWYSFTFFIPIGIPLLWGENFWVSYFLTMFRWVFGLHCVWSINSFAHLYGRRPYNKDINPAENDYVAYFSLGEGFHNYHHVFPWDYKVAEIAIYHLNFTAMCIDFFAMIGWAYDLKSPSKELIKKTVMQFGDGSHPDWGHIKEVPEEADEIYRKEEKIKAT